MKKLLFLILGVCLLLAGCSKTTTSGQTTDAQSKQETKEEVKEEKKEETPAEQETQDEEEKSEEPEESEETVLTVEDIIQNPEAYVDTYVYVRGNLPQATGGKDENGDWILFFAGANDLNQHIRIINYVPGDGSCLVEAYGTIVYLENGELAISMDGYTILQNSGVVGGA